MSNHNTPAEAALDLLVHSAADVKVLVADQREIADRQHRTAHQLDNLSSTLKREVIALQKEIKESEAGYPYQTARIPPLSRRLRPIIVP
jgi:hypothetical protein